MLDIEFKNFIQLQRGFDLPEHSRILGNVPVVASTSISGFHNVAKVKAPGVVTGRSGALGEVQFINEDFWPLNTTLWVKDFKNNDPKYVYYFLKTIDFKRYNSGAGVPTLNRNDLDTLKIKIHEKNEQLKIAKLLSNYDDLIENNNRRIKILEEMAQKIYKEWFVDFKFPGHETTTFKDSHLGKIPNDWDVKKTTDLGETLTGKTPSKAKNSYYGADIPFIKTPDMHNSIFCIKTNEMLSKIGAESQKNKYVPANSICVSCIGTVGVVSITTKICQTNQQINTIIPKKEFYREFIYFYFSNLKNKLENLGANGATMTNVNKNKFDNIEILKPNNDLLQTFSKIIAPFFEEVKILSIKNESLKQTRDILLPCLISGEINVENIEVL